MNDKEKRDAGFRPYRKIAWAWAKPMDEDFEVETDEGRMKGKAGDYLCIGAAGERWPIKKEIFESTYVSVSGVKVAT